ncbi:DUF6891 domain-containing protein [Methanobrevibacter sp.]
MVEELLDEIKEEIVFFSKCGFYDKDEILETIEDEFIDFDLDLDLISDYLDTSFNKHQQYTNSEDFNNLKLAFDDLNKTGIISIHNNAYDIQEGVNDAFEVYTHLLNNNYSPIGFCFYTLSDLEELFENKKLSLYYGSFDLEDELKQRQIEDLIENTFKKYGFDIEKSDEQFIIYNFNWLKVYDNKEYSMEGAYEDFIKFNKKEE